MRLFILAVLMSCYCPLPHAMGPKCDCDAHKMCSDCDPIESEVSTKEPDAEVQAAYEEIANFALTRDIEWDVQGHWTVVLRFEDRELNKTKVWAVTGPRLKAAVDTVEKDVYDFPEGHERTQK